jgi:signal transduction histidine kinase
MPDCMMQDSRVSIGGDWADGNDLPGRSWWLTAAVGLTAIGVATVGIRSLDWGAVAIMTALGLGTGLFAFPIGRGSYVSFSTAVFVASLALFGTPVAIWVVAATTGILNAVCFRRNVRSALADMGAQVIAAAAAGIAYRLVGGRLVPTSMTFLDAGRCLLMFVTYGAVASLMRSVAAVTTRNPLAEYARWIAGRGVIIELAMLPLALLLIASYTPGEPATFPLLAVVLMVSSAAGKALWDAREALVKRVGELRVLNEAAHALSDARHARDIVTAIRGHAGQLLGARVLTLSLCNDESAQVESHVTPDGSGADGVDHPHCPTSAEAWVMKHRLPLVAQDPAHNCPDEWSRGPEERPGTGAWLGVPVVRGRKLLGVLSVVGSGRRSLCQQDAELLSALGNQVARVIENVRLYERLEESRADLERWNRTLEEKVGERTREVERARAELEQLNGDLELRVAQRTQALESIQTKVVESGRLAAAGELAAGIAKELNNPLAGILGYSQYDLERMLERQDKGFSPEETCQLATHMRHIEREAQRCKRIVENLLTFSRGARSSFTNVNVNTVLEQTLEYTERQLAMRGIQVDLKLDTALPCIVGDCQELQQVFANIILNARNAMANGGKLTIRTSIDENAAREKRVAVRFEDTGCGIPPEDLTRIFEPFFTTGAAGSASGLGLSVSYGIVKEHGGDINVESGRGVGAAFTVRLPMAAGTETS